MIKLDPYLNFQGHTEEAFNFYKSIFGGDFKMIQRFKEISDFPGKEKMSMLELEKIMHISLKVGDNILMGTDALESQGQVLIPGNNISLSLSVDSKEGADKLFSLLQVGGKVEMPMQNMFWGAYFGMIQDKFGVKWMISYESN